MSTFPEATKDTPKRGIISRALVLISLTLLLAACSAVRLAYNQSPALTYWWIDGYADLDEVQTARLRQDIDAYFDWHRSSELPRYVERLRQWQQLASVDSTPDLACKQFDHLRSAYLRLIDHGLEPMARLALTLTPQQILHIQRKYAKNNQAFDRDFISGGEERRLDKLMERALDRYETLYGELSPTQLGWLRESIRQSPFDARRINAERLRRQSDLLDTLRALKADPDASVGSATRALRRWHDRVMQSPLPGFATYSDSLVRSGCEQFAALHNTTTATQRAHAIRVLKDYEADLRALSAPD